MKLMKAAFGLLAVLCALTIAPQAMAQTPETFTSYVVGLPSATSLAGTEKIVGYQSGAIKGMTPYQILSEVTGDCTMTSPPSIVCTGSSGRTFAASAFTDTTNAGNIGSGTLGLARLGLPNAQLYVGNASGNPAAVAMSNDCSIANTGAITCTKTNGVAFAPSATTDTTNASNISSGTLNTARLPAPFTSGSIVGNTSKFATIGTTTPASGHIAVGDGSGNLIDGGAAGSGTMTDQVNTAGNGLLTSGNCNNTTTNSSNPCQYQLATITGPGVLGSTNNGAGQSVGTVKTPMLLNTITASSSAQLADITSLTGAFSAYRIDYYNIIPANTNDTLVLQIYSGGGYQGAGYVTQGSIVLDGTVQTEKPNYGLVLNHTGQQQNTGPGVSGSVVINNPSTTDLHMMWGNGGYGSPTEVVPITFTGFWNSNSVITGFRLIEGSGGNIASGFVKVTGIP